MIYKFPYLFFCNKIKLKLHIHAIKNQNNIYIQRHEDDIQMTQLSMHAGGEMGRTKHDGS